MDRRSGDAESSWTGSYQEQENLSGMALNSALRGKRQATRHIYGPLLPYLVFMRIPRACSDSGRCDEHLVDARLQLCRVLTAARMPVRLGVEVC